MSQDTPTIQAELRERTGSKYAARLRKAGKMPVVIYGHGQDVAHASVDSDEIVSHIIEGAHLLDVNLAGKPETCLIKELQFDYLGTTVIHVDLVRVSMNEDITVDVSVVLKGEEECKAIAASGAILEHPLTTLEVSCRANNIPEEIVVDISELEIGHTVTVSELELPKGVSTAVAEDTAVAYISIVQEQEEEAPEDAAGAEPEVISEAKADDAD